MVLPFSQLWTSTYYVGFSFVWSSVLSNFLLASDSQWRADGAFSVLSNVTENHSQSALVLIIPSYCAHLIIVYCI
jgi:hypothetical protein